MASLLQQQIAYYRARATEYNEWWLRQGRYDRGEEQNQLWFQEGAMVRTALHQLPTQEHILEIAAGTGLWTHELLNLGQRITAIDAAPEMIAINKQEVASERVSYIESDIFAWQPTEQYDMVFFSFWLSHVPPEKLNPFLQTVYNALKPNGYVFILDSRRVDSSTATDQVIPETGTSLQRKLNDGRTFEIVKIFYDPHVLQTTLTDIGWQAEVKTTPNFFIYAQGQKQG